jgi:light-regulated signal transduction histidine kinase (bacteriophytochrome)
VDDSDLKNEVDTLNQRIEMLEHELTKKTAQLAEYENKGERAVSRSLKKSLIKSSKRLEAKNRELNQFIYAASHDLLEPVNTIISTVSVMDEEGLVDSDGDEGIYYGFIDGASKRMKGLVVGLLDFSLIGRNEADSYVNLNQTISDVRKDIKASIDAGEASFRAAPMPIVTGNKDELQSLFQHLLSNAIKFQHPDRKPIIGINFSGDEDYWTFSFKDNGIGISEIYLTKVFELFQRLHAREQYDGLGLGLAYCWKIVNVHGGDIWIESDDQGTTVFFTIPK